MERWNPWRALRATSVELWFAPLHGDRGRWIRRPEGDEILLEETLDRRSRREVLAHELVHAERGVGWPDATAATMELEEERVWRIALRRLAPPNEVAEFVARRSSAGAVSVSDLAEEFDLSNGAAERLVRLLAVEERLPWGSPADDLQQVVVHPEAVEPKGHPHR